MFFRFLSISICTGVSPYFRLSVRVCVCARVCMCAILPLSFPPLSGVREYARKREFDLRSSAINVQLSSVFHFIFPPNSDHFIL